MFITLYYILYVSYNTFISWKTTYSSFVISFLQYIVVVLNCSQDLSEDDNI